MLINVCIAKLHRVTVTDADLDYVGSITIDEALLEAAGLLPGQMVTINNLSNAVTWRTYIMKGQRGKGQIVLNGPPARIFQKGDKVVFSNVGPVGASSINGTYTVSPSDSTGTSFTITDWYTSPSGLWTLSDDGKTSEYKATVEIVLKDGAPAHVTTDALPAGFKGQILLSIPGNPGATRYSPTNIQSTGFDLADTQVKLSGGVIPFSRMPNCTGTVVKQPSGTPPTVDASRPCTPWRSFPAFEAKQI